MKVRFLKPAQSEVDDAVALYDSQSSSIGTQFLDDLTVQSEESWHIPYQVQK